MLSKLSSVEHQQDPFTPLNMRVEIKSEPLPKMQDKQLQPSLANYENKELAAEDQNNKIVVGEARKDYPEKRISKLEKNKSHLAKATQELVDIIRNMQEQLHQISAEKKKVDRMPSDVLEPKNKTFFKKPAVDRGNKTSVNNNSKTNVSKKSSSTKQGSDSSSYQSLSIASTRRFVSKYSSQSMDPLKRMKDEVQRAIRERKTFTIRGSFEPIRRALVQRGWIEKFHFSYHDHVGSAIQKYKTYTVNELIDLYKTNHDLAAVCKRLIQSKLLGSHQVDFYWMASINDVAYKENPDKIKYTLISQFKRGPNGYTTKRGLCDAAKVAHWYQKPGVSKLNHPRSYGLGKNGDTNEFIYDFNVTAAMALLKWIVRTSVTKECKLLSPTGKIPLIVYEFALNECCKFIKRRNHEDIDAEIADALDHEWTQFLDFFYKIVHFNNHFKKENGEATEEAMVRKSSYVLNNLREVWPCLDMDGYNNIWILKPAASSRGKGIHICRTLSYVLKVVQQNQNVRYVIQKYIERPLLIYNTKFDIRQWILITNASPLTVWIYKDCYLRFSSETYNLRKLHESIHLTNYAVQSKYRHQILDAALPGYNMWSLAEFQTYLSNIGYSNVYQTKIYPAMKQSVVAALLIHQDKLLQRPNTFEMYGADFLITEDFQPWLLEINSNPALRYVTPVTAKLVPAALEDVIKVVVDRAHNSKADTGKWELLYQQKNPTFLPTSGLEVTGRPLSKDYFYTPPKTRAVKSVKQLNLVSSQPADYVKKFGQDMRITLTNLLQLVQEERQRRQTEDKNVGCELSTSREKKDKTKIGAHVKKLLNIGA